MRLILSIIILLSTISIQAQIEIKKPLKTYKSSFAIVTDNETYKRTADAIGLYREAVEKDGLSTYIIIGKWNNPEEIKSELLKLFKGDIPIEGAVFIGDVPIPMIRNAQHMTSAFKLPEDRYPIHRSSVPSDRYYDDFDLMFKYLGPDSTRSLYHYYSMLPESPQKIERDIYSGRIKPPVDDDTKYELINKYLKKAANAKQNVNPIDEMLVFTGHGYYSSSTTSWADERLSLREQFPQLYKSGNRIKHLHHEMSDDLKDIIIEELQKPELDIAIFHAHGSVDMQYILDYPNGGNIQGYAENMKLYFRSKIRTAKNKNKDVEEAKEYYRAQYKLTDDWFEGAFEDSIIAADSILGYSLDIYSEDIEKIKTQAEFVIFDECFNGSFHQENYIAGRYIFNDGNTIAGEANTVNCLQDKWADEYLGLINRGLSIGQWHQFTNLLESHIIGDPTYKFGSTGDDDIWDKIKNEEDDEELWRQYLSGGDPELRALAINMIYKKKGAEFAKEAAEIYLNDNSLNVRMHALKCLAETGGDEFHEILKVSVNDPYELIRRFSTIWMGEVGKEEYLPYILHGILNDESARVPFNGRSSLSFIDNNKAKETVEKYISESNNPRIKEKLGSSILGSISRNNDWIYKELLPNIKNDTLKLKEKLQEIRTFRNYHFHEAVPELIKISADKSQDEKVRVQLLETLGWFNMHHENKSKIIAVCESIIADSENPEEVKAEALRTKNRLLAGLNNIFIP